jgi:phosphonate transport system permease protein
VSTTPVTAASRKEVIHAGRGEMLHLRLRSFAFDLFLVVYSVLCLRYLWGLWAGRPPFAYAGSTAILIAGILTLIWRVSGASIGARLLGLVLVSGPQETPARATPGGRFRRGLLWPVSVLPLGAGVWGPILAGGSLGLHDRASGTRWMRAQEFDLRQARAAARGEVPLPVKRRPWYSNPTTGAAVVILALTYLTGWYVTQVDLVKLVTRAGSSASIFSALVHPNWAIWEPCARAMLETIYLALMATTIAVPIAFLVSFLGARNLMSGSPTRVAIYYFVRTTLNISRSIEPIVWAIIFAVWVGIGPFAGVLALAIQSVAGLGKLYSEQIESIDRGPLEAISATGANAAQVIAYGVVPQILPPYLAFTMYRWDINVRMATIIGFVGGGGIGALLIQYQGLLRWQSVGLILWMITVVVWVMDLASAKLRERLT